MLTLAHCAVDFCSRGVIGVGLGVDIQDKQSDIVGDEGWMRHNMTAPIAEGVARVPEVDLARKIENRGKFRLDKQPKYGMSKVDMMDLGDRGLVSVMSAAVGKRAISFR